MDEFGLCLVNPGAYLRQDSLGLHNLALELEGLLAGSDKMSVGLPYLPDGFPGFAHISESFVILSGGLLPVMR